MSTEWKVGDRVVIARPKHAMWKGSEATVATLPNAEGHMDVRLVGDRRDHVLVMVTPDALDAAPERSTAEASEGRHRDVAVAEIIGAVRDLPSIPSADGADFRARLAWILEGFAARSARGVDYEDGAEYRRGLRHGRKVGLIDAAEACRAEAARDLEIEHGAMRCAETIDALIETADEHHTQPPGTFEAGAEWMRDQVQTLLRNVDIPVASPRGEKREG